LGEKAKLISSSDDFSRFLRERVGVREQLL
jgi:hypothetical protein